MTVGGGEICHDRLFLGRVINVFCLQDFQPGINRETETPGKSDVIERKSFHLGMIAESTVSVDDGKR